MQITMRNIIVSGLIAAGLTACTPHNHDHTSSPHDVSKTMIIKKTSPYSASETIDRLETILRAKGLTVFTRVDHAAGAKNVDIEMSDSKLIIFGNPKLGTPLMLESPQMGLDLPLKALAYTDASGQTFLTYVAPKTLQSRHDISANIAIIDKMTGALDAMTNAAVAQD